MADIVHRIEAAAGPEKVFPFVGSGAGFRAWWAEDVAVAPDGTAELGFFGRATVYRLKPLDLDAGRRAAWLCESGAEWSGTRLVFELEARKAATAVRFTHADWAKPTEYFESCNTTWGELMFRLKAVAEGRKPGPLFSAGGMAY